jgi:hypothetical protein
MAECGPEGRGGGRIALGELNLSESRLRQPDQVRRRALAGEGLGQRDRTARGSLRGGAVPQAQLGASLADQGEDVRPLLTKTFGLTLYGLEPWAARVLARPMCDRNKPASGRIVSSAAHR